MSRFRYSGILISGLPLSGKTSLEKRLSEMYGWRVYAVGELFRDMYRKEHPDGDITFERYWELMPAERNMRINVQAGEHLRGGNVIGDTRYTKLYPDLDFLRVFVLADIDVRVERAIRGGRYAGSPDDVRGIIEGRERQEMKISRELFGYDYTAPGNFHVSINSGKMSVDDEVALIDLLMRAH